MTGVRVALLSPKHAQLTWEPAERAVRYKVRTLVVGKANEFQAVAEV